MNEQQVSTLMVRMRGIWPDLIINEDTEQAWCWALEDASLTDVTVAVKQLMKTQKFTPKPAEILEIVAENATGLPTPSAAWGLVLAFMQGKTSIPDWRNNVPDQVHQAVKQIGGISTLRRSELPAADQKRFIQAYTAIRDQAVRDVQVNGTPPPFQPRSLGGPWTEVQPGVVTNQHVAPPLDTHGQPFALPSDLLAKSGDD